MGLVLGTPAFMPPEQARGRWEEVGAPSDLWAVGATLFTALTGRLLHGGETPMEELVLATQPVGAIAALAREIDAPLAAVLGRALAYRPEARFATAGDMQTALRMATPRPAPEIAAPIPSPRPAVARQTWAIAAAVALAGALTFALSGVRGAPSPSNVELPSPPSPAPSPTTTTTTAHAVASAAMEDVRPAPPPETVPPRRQRTALPTPAPSLRALVVPAPAPPRRDPLLEGRF
jgi:serine/threonine-protein kinase